VSTELDLDELERLAAAATPGEWSYDWGAVWAAAQGGGRMVLLDMRSYNDDRFEEAPHDGAFIAAARTAVPALIARVRELEAAVAAVLPVAYQFHGLFVVCRHCDAHAPGITACPDDVVHLQSCPVGKAAAAIRARATGGGHAR
jgi:hypothetical protein